MKTGGTQYEPCTQWCITMNTFVVRHRDGRVSTYTDITYISCSLGIWKLYRRGQLMATLDRLDCIDYDVPARKYTAYEDEL